MSVVSVQRSRDWKHYSAHFQPISFPDWKWCIAVQTRVIAASLTETVLATPPSHADAWICWSLIGCCQSRLVDVLGSRRKPLRQTLCLQKHDFLGIASLIFWRSGSPVKFLGGSVGETKKRGRLRNLKPHVWVCVVCQRGCPTRWQP